VPVKVAGHEDARAAVLRRALLAQAADLARLVHLRAVFQLSRIYGAAKNSYFVGFRCGKKEKKGKNVRIEQRNKERKE